MLYSDIHTSSVSKDLRARPKRKTDGRRDGDTVRIGYRLVWGQDTVHDYGTKVQQRTNKQLILWNMSFTARGGCALESTARLDESSGLSQADAVLFIVEISLKS